jgi:hypothetical protein
MPAVCLLTCVAHDFHRQRRVGQFYSLVFDFALVCMRIETKTLDNGSIVGKIAEAWRFPGIGSGTTMVPEHHPRRRAAGSHHFGQLAAPA